MAASVTGICPDVDRTRYDRGRYLHDDYCLSDVSAFGWALLGLIMAVSLWLAWRY